ncbi:tRNA (adenosine(37)-N6)-dimethylallyltransferase MiaA [Silvibacterium acidisoli]|uniref:tRNA (adenosine(37)-N6)-dimethylallyltransferase MiaA n=1 Tax=Acidobacteriaceae bacterium ZG23-2 TaxID=2883246 RepID=UPI00406D3F6A
MVALLVADPLLVVLLGPTASGKTALSLKLAERFHGEIVSCDSMCVYREMEIGTAKPSPEERQLVPHHLVDVFAPHEECTAGDYARLAREALGQITGRGHLPIVTGGTGLYLRALTDGLFAGPVRSEDLRHRLQQSLEKRGSPWLHRVLQRLDPASAALIHANDAPKLIRAIEVAVSSEKPLSEGWKSGRDPLHGFRILRIGLNAVTPAASAVSLRRNPDPARQALYDRINTRAARMFEVGLVEETRRLIEKYGEAPRVFDALGYRQARAVLRGEMTQAEAIAAAQQGHRNYAKRQYTWFRKEPDVRWLNGFGDDPEIIAQAEALVQAEL